LVGIAARNAVPVLAVIGAAHGYAGDLGDGVRLVGRSSDPVRRYSSFNGWGASLG